MATNASRSSLYEEITLEKTGETPVALEARTVRFTYFESLFSPYVSADLTYIDTGNGLTANGTDTQERFGTIRSSLPIAGGGLESVKFKITNTLGSLDFLTKSLKVQSVIPLGQESTRELVTLKLVSEAEIKNETITMHEKYDNNITNSVSSILTQKLQIPSSRLFLDRTKNSASFIGSSERPFNVIIKFARQAIPLKGSAGFLFWENKDGFNFKAVDNIVSAAPYQYTYKYHGVYTRLNDFEKNFRILAAPTVKQDQNLLRALKSGLYLTKNVAFNQYTGQVTERYIKFDQSGIISSGKTPEYDEVFLNRFSATKINYFVTDVGATQSGISTAINNDQLDHYAKAAMRYNLLLSQVLDITVPANPNLRAGDVIRCEFEKITVSNKNEGSVDHRYSGDYVIMNLCHYFTPRNSFTNLRIVRDGYGLYTSKKQ